MREPGTVLVVALVSSLAVLAACPSSPPPPPPVPGVPGVPAPTPQVPQAPQVPPAGGGQITIAPGPGGGMQIEGIPQLHGDPAACAAFHACCAPHQGQLSPAGLACGLAPGGSNGDCAQSLQTVRGVFTEQHIPLPAGCAP